MPPDQEQRHYLYPKQLRLMSWLLKVPGSGSRHQIRLFEKPGRRFDKSDFVETLDRIGAHHERSRLVGAFTLSRWRGHVPICPEVFG